MIDKFLNRTKIHFYRNSHTFVEKYLFFTVLKIYSLNVNFIFNPADIALILPIPYWGSSL